MADFFTWLSSNSIAATIVVVAIGFVAVAVIIIFMVAFFQGREVIFWPPKVGAKLQKTDTNNSNENSEKNSGDSHADLAGRILVLERTVSDFEARISFEEQVIAELPRHVTKQISALFSSRDSAVAERDRRKFLSTQLDGRDIANGSSTGYLAISKLTTAVLQVASARTQAIGDDELKVDYVALVREDYERNNRHTHSAYIAYNIAAAEDGLKIVSLQSL